MRIGPFTSSSAPAPARTGTPASPARMHSRPRPARGQFPKPRRQAAVHSVAKDSAAAAGATGDGPGGLGGGGGGGDEFNSMAHWGPRLEDEADIEMPEMPKDLSHIPDLPFTVGDDFLDKIKEYLIEEENMDRDDKGALEEAALEMAKDMCEEVMQDDSMDEQIVADLEARAAPFAKVQERWEKDPATLNPEAVEDDEEDPSFENEDGMEIPANVNVKALHRIMEWEAEAAVGPEAKHGGFGWRPERGGLHPAAATAMLGMGSWRMRRHAHHLATELIANTESFLRQLFHRELAAANVDPRWKRLDSANPDEVDLAFSIRDPQPGQPGYPRTVIENRFYATRVFRTVHLEIFVRQDGFQVVHMVLWPHREYTMPILGVDAVFNTDGKVQFFTADASPGCRRAGAAGEAVYPEGYMDGVRMLKAQYVGGLRPATVGESYREVFSEEAVLVRPEHPVEAELCVMYGLALIRMHMLYGMREEWTTEEETLADIDRTHRRYCEVQRQNSKTMRTLESSFSHLGPRAKDLAERYMSEVCFDYEFYYDVDADTKAELRQTEFEYMGVERAPEAAAEAAAEEMANKTAEGVGKMMASSGKDEKDRGDEGDAKGTGRPSGLR